MRSVFATVALSMLLLLILDESLPPRLVTSVNAFPAAVTSASPEKETSNVTSDLRNTSNLSSTQSLISSESALTAGEVTEYPVFISATEETQSEPDRAESEVVTETYMIVEDQEIEDDDSDSSTVTPAVVWSTTPMPSPKSSPQQEEVLRELKKLWDLSEGMNDNGNDVLKNSLSSIVHLAYARVYFEPDETLMKLKYLLQQLQERILLGKDSHSDDVISSTTMATMPSSSVSLETHAAASNYLTTTESPTNVIMTATTPNSIDSKTRIEFKMRRKRSYYEGRNNDVEAIFFANVNSGENSLLSEEQNDFKKLDKLQKQMNEQRDNSKLNLTVDKDVKAGNSSSKLNNIAKLDDPAGDVDHTWLSIENASSISTMSTSTNASSSPQKIVRINDRKKLMPSFYLTPERIKELKSRVTSPSTTTTTIPTLETAKQHTLSPVSIIIDDEVENEVNSLQQQHHVDNYDIHISSPDIAVVPLTTATPPNLSSHKNPLFDESAMTINLSPTNETPFTAEDIALALFQLLRPDTFDDDEESEDENVTAQPHPTPSSILYQVGSLSSVLNFTISSKNASTSTMATTTAITTTVPEKITTQVPFLSTMAPIANVSTTLSFLQLKEMYMTKIKNNATLHEPPLSALSDLGFTTSTTSRTTTTGTTTSTERQNISPNNDVYDSTDVLDLTTSADYSKPSITTSIVQGTQEGIQQVVGAVTRLSIGAKMVLLFSLSISILSIGIGIYALGPPIAGVGVLGIIIPIALLLVFETSASGGKKLTTRQRQQLLMNKLQSEEFSKVLDMIFDAAVKYSSG